MQRTLIFLISFLSLWLLLSNSSGVPQAVTKAPGEANHNSCATCHSPSGNFIPAVTLDILTPDSAIVSQYQPGQTYIVRLKVSATNNPKAFGFQMACLDSLTNTDYGVWSSFGDRVKQQTLNVGGKQRKYLVQSAPRANGVFTAQWKAPSNDVGKIKFYVAGLAINQNGNTGGDNHKVAQFTLQSPLSASTTNPFQRSPIVYPNPVDNECRVGHPGTRTIYVTDYQGICRVFPCADALCTGLEILPPGLYIFSGYNEAENLLWQTRVVKR